MTTRVLFLCTGNSVRSQMAEAFLRKYGGEDYEAHSAGLVPKDLHPLTVLVMNEIGMDISGQHSKGTQGYPGRVLFQYLITVCEDADRNCPTVWPGITHRMHWSFQDPAAFEGSDQEKLAKFRQVRDEIEKKVIDWLAEAG